MNKIEGQTATVNCFGKDYKVRLILEHYTDNDRPAIHIDHWDEELSIQLPFGCLTVNIPEVLLEPNQCFIKTWSENEEWAPALMQKLDCFNVVSRVDCGYTQALKVQLKEDWTWE